MASTKNSRPAPDPDAQLIAAALAAQLSIAPEHVSTAAPVAVAFSGGVDSTVLLHALVSASHTSPATPIIALHVHHGLSPNADAWLAHCAAVCAELGVAFDSARVHLQRSAVHSLEADARQARYGALQALCARHGARRLLTAHHADDQAETLLLNLLRGSGIAGLAGAAGARPLNAELQLLRPLLRVPGASLRHYARLHGLRWIEDESNVDTRHARNAIRHTLMPVLRDLAPSVVERLAQTAAHASAAQSLLDEVGRADLPAADDGASVSIAALLALSPTRAANALRAWLRDQHLSAPSSAVLADMLRQIAATSARASDHNMRLSLGQHGLFVRAYRGQLQIQAESAVAPPDWSGIWSGQTELIAPGWPGRLLIEPCLPEQPGISAAWLRARDLRIVARSGGERLRLHARRPSRPLKKLYQELGVPSWRRGQLPLVYAGKDLLYAAGLGMEACHLARHLDSAGQDERVLLRWDASGWTA